MKRRREEVEVGMRKHPYTPGRLAGTGPSALRWQPQLRCRSSVKRWTAMDGDSTGMAEGKGDGAGDGPSEGVGSGGDGGGRKKKGGKKGWR